MTYAINWIFAGGSMVLVVLYVHLRFQVAKLRESKNFLLDAFNDILEETIKNIEEAKNKEKRIKELTKELENLKKEDNNE